jgi:hypothetical protein
MICFLLNFFSGYVFLFVPLDEVGKILRHWNVCSKAPVNYEKVSFVYKMQPDVSFCQIVFRIYGLSTNFKISWAFMKLRVLVSWALTQAFAIRTHLLLRDLNRN